MEKFSKASDAQGLSATTMAMGGQLLGLTLAFLSAVITDQAKIAGAS